MDLLTVIKRSPIALPLACALVITVVVISESSHQQAAGELDALGEIGGARSSLRDLQQSILAAEAGQRGYLLTKRREHVQSYDEALREVDTSFEFLRRYYGDDAKSGERLRKLRTLTDTRLSELALAIRLHDAGWGAASTDIVLSELNKKQMDDIRALSGELLQAEVRKVEAGREHLYRTLKFSRIGLAALSTLSVLALLLYLRQTLAVRQQEQDMNRLVQDDRNRLEREVVKRTAQLTDLTRHLQTAREDERQRLARNLHDELGALLTSAKLDAARIRSRLTEAAPEAQERLAHLVGTLNSSIALGRRIIEDLRPSTLSNLGLAPTLEILLGEFAKNTNVEAHCEVEPVRLDASSKLMIYRLVQEALTNISKYAQARHVWVKLAAHDGEVEVSVRDDGVGFSPGVTSTSAYGLVGMRFRVEAEGGRLRVVSAPGQGTQLTATLAEKPPSPA